MNYTELEVWKTSRKLLKRMFVLSDLFPVADLYKLTNRVKRCSISVPSNIVNGLGRQSNSQTIPFLQISRSSLFKLETQLFLAFDLNYVSEEQLKHVTSCKKPCNGFLNYFKLKK